MKIFRTEYDLTTTTWRTSTYSGASGGDCLETSDQHPGVVPVRDSKLRGGGPVLVFRADVWAAFVTDLKAG
ncbi:DUF397 domain-containing protein [Streptomyces sp. AM 2-1-1]|uniref:DUF397 domain-containing protein n=1 Tax=Streptomyces sp. AM 2-1-1 TaxID=3028709 RepID=UPI0023B90940|nr:DUF397 domain-containing protein [Streptomyces sp. AM 2-1-1]WEH41163.1 DUF397 domain-containing protein [Streptomyces sp. AM 2-1-1]